MRIIKVYGKLLAACERTIWLYYPFCAWSRSPFPGRGYPPLGSRLPPTLTPYPGTLRISRYCRHRREHCTNHVWKQTRSFFPYTAIFEKIEGNCQKSTFDVFELWHRNQLQLLFLDTVLIYHPIYLKYLRLLQKLMNS